jgi:GNAT superfamily N-acetyltransferase
METDANGSMPDRSNIGSICVRTAIAADLPLIAGIHMASWRDAYRSVIPDEILSARTIEGSLHGWRSTFAQYPDNITVAEAANAEPVGFCCAGPVVDVEKNEPFEFEIYGLHVAPHARRNGLGAALLRDAFKRAVVLEGMNSAIVWTLKGLEMSREFYAREGGEFVKTGTWRIGGVAIPEVAYGWMRLDRFRAKI